MLDTYRVSARSRLFKFTIIILLRLGPVTTVQVMQTSGFLVEVKQARSTSGPPVPLGSFQGPTALVTHSRHILNTCRIHTHRRCYTLCSLRTVSTLNLKECENVSESTSYIKSVPNITKPKLRYIVDVLSLNSFQFNLFYFECLYILDYFHF